MRWDSPLVLAIAGTLAIHIIIFVAGDAVVVLNPPSPVEIAPHIDLVDVELPPIVKPLPPPVREPEPVVQQHDDPRPVPHVPTHRTTAPAQQIEQAPQPVVDHQPAVAGGEQVVSEENIAPASTGVGVRIGKPTDRVGRGGAGGGTGGGSGSGSADEPPKPMSVATIKTMAKVRGDYGYFSAGKNYPREALQLGIEGVIKVKLIVDDHGKVKRSVLLNRLGHGLDELALERAAIIEFEPALDTDDHPVSSVVVWTFNMTLPK